MKHIKSCPCLILAYAMGVLQFRQYSSKYYMKLQGYENFKAYCAGQGFGHELTYGFFANHTRDKS
jgi:hypothetical protein